VYREALEKNITEKGDVIIKLREKIYTKISECNEKSERKEELEAMYWQKAREIALTEEVVKEEIKEVKERLEILQVVKRRDKMKTKKEQEILLTEIKALED